MDKLFNVAQAIATAINGIGVTIRSVFPQTTGTSATATAGAATLPANPVGFMVVVLPNGTAVKVAYYAT